MLSLNMGCLALCYSGIYFGDCELFCIWYGFNIRAQYSYLSEPTKLLLSHLDKLFAVLWLSLCLYVDANKGMSDFYFLFHSNDPPPTYRADIMAFL